MPNGFVFGDRGLGASGDTHPLWTLGHALADPYLVVGTSAVGQIHLAHGQPRDDAFIVRSLGPWLAIGVADGVGSRPLSRYGATYAVEALTALLLRPFAMPLHVVRANHHAGLAVPPSANLAPPTTGEEVELTWPSFAVQPVEELSDAADPTTPDALQQGSSVGWWLPPGDDAVNPDGQQTEPALDDVMDQAFEKAHLGLRTHAQSLGLDLADLSCTALALLLNRETGRAVVGQVGDGALLGLTRQGDVSELVEAPDTHDPQSTYTLNRPNFQKYLAVRELPPTLTNEFVAFYVMTDGLSGDLLFSSQQDALSHWAQAVKRNLLHAASPAQAAAGMLNWLATYQVKGSWDDRTLVVVTQREPRT